jgi:hypothetical protein
MNSPTCSGTALKNNGLFNWHAPCIVLAKAEVGPTSHSKGTTMFNFTSAREQISIFAAALVSAMLLVSAATSLPIV